MNRKVILPLAVILGIAAALGLMAVVVLARGGGYSIPWDVVASGGEQMASANYLMLSSAGEALVGESTGSAYGLEAGFWYAEGEGHVIIYLPLVLRNYP